MPATLTPDTSIPTRESDPSRTDLRPDAVALEPSVDAVRDALTHMDDDAILSVPVGAPHEHFDVVEWCASHRKPVVNRFDPWPLETLLVENAPADSPITADRSFVAAFTTVDGGTAARRPIRDAVRRFVRRNGSADRSLDQAWHESKVAHARARVPAGMF